MGMGIFWFQITRTCIISLLPIRSRGSFTRSTSLLRGVLLRRSPSLPFRAWWFLRSVNS